MNARVNISQKSAAIAEGCTLGCIMRSADITGGTYYTPLVGTAEAASGTWHPVLGLQFKTDVEELRKAQQRATKMVRAYSK